MSSQGFYGEEWNGVQLRLWQLLALISLIQIHRKDNFQYLEADHLHLGNHKVSRIFIDLLMKEEEADLGHNPWGKDRDEVLDRQSADLAEAYLLNPEININFIIWELEEGHKSYIHYLSNLVQYDDVEH